MPEIDYEPTADAWTRTETTFDSHGSRCHGWLYRPEGVENAPIVVMAHGFAGEKPFALPNYAERFVERGLAVLIFDYRYFGPSEGQPRGLVNHNRQLEDWQAAVAHARSLDGIDAKRIALWGTSFSGGLVLMVAARTPGIAAVISQVPMVDVLGSAAAYRPIWILKAVWHGLHDLARAAFGLAPHYVPIVGSADEFAVLNGPGCESGYRSLLPDGIDWPNATPARVLLTSLFHRPISSAPDVQCPVMVILAERDQLILPSTIRRCVKRLPHAMLVSVPLDHFEPYFGDHFELLVEQQADFLAAHLVQRQ